MISRCATSADGDTIHRNMKPIIITALTFAALTTGLHAQLPPQMMTMGVVNCRGWAQSFSNDLKRGFTMGFGAAKILIKDKSVSDQMSSDAPVVEIVRGVDALCQAPENGPLPLYVAMIVYIRKTRGASDAQINAALQEARKNVASQK
jgi:hypothetical protein